VINGIIYLKALGAPSAGKRNQVVRVGRLNSNRLQWTTTFFWGVYSSNQAFTYIHINHRRKNILFS